MIKRLGSLFLVAVLCMSLATVGCQKKVTVTNLPPGVTQTQVNSYYTAVGISKTIANSADNITDAVIQLNREGIFPDGAAYANTLRSLGKIAQAGKRADAALKEAPQYFGAREKAVVYSLIQDVADELNTVELQSTLGIKSDQAKATIVALTKTIELALQTARTISQ